ncbi:MAG: mechanosensitive ion channel domain-containing protein [Campylobacterales bacterium]
MGGISLKIGALLVAGGVAFGGFLPNLDFFEQNSSALTVITSFLSSNDSTTTLQTPPPVEEELGEQNLSQSDQNQTLPVDSISLQISQLEEELNQSQFFLNYQAYITYKNLSKKVEKLQKLARRNKKKYWNDYISAKEKLAALTPQNNLFDALIKLTPIDPPPQITNPFQIFEVLGYEKQLKEKLKENRRYYHQFLETLTKMRWLYNLKKSKKVEDPILAQAISDFELTNEIYKSKLKEIETQGKSYLRQARQEIENQINKLINLGIAVGISLIFFFILKLLVKRYVKDESAYLINKVLNFINITIIVFLISGAYMENASSLLTFLGFASAGIAIAMKDWFMNMFGWLVIMVSGNFKVGDRIKIYLQNGNVQIVGDVIDITLNRIVIYEDVTYTTYRRIRRAGRIVFVPNNVVFNNPIFNYTHHGLNTVWDGIDIMLTFDSNLEKAEGIVKEVLNIYAKPFCDMTRKKVDKLRMEYNLKRVSLEPRIFTFIEEYGVKLSFWYVAPYAPMRLRSKISKEILARFKQESDIHLAYPTYESIVRPSTPTSLHFPDHTPNLPEEVRGVAPPPGTPRRGHPS